MSRARIVGSMPKMLTKQNIYFFVTLEDGSITTCLFLDNLFLTLSTLSSDLYIILNLSLFWKKCNLTGVSLYCQYLEQNESTPVCRLQT